MASTFIGMGTKKETKDIENLKKENAKLVKANEKAQKEKATLETKLAKANEKVEKEKATAEENLAKANEKIAELEAKLEEKAGEQK